MCLFLIICEFGQHCVTSIKVLKFSNTFTPLLLICVFENSKLFTKCLSGVGLSVGRRTKGWGGGLILSKHLNLKSSFVLAHWCMLQHMMRHQQGESFRGNQFIGCKLQFIYNIIGFSLLLLTNCILTVAGLEEVVVYGMSKNLNLLLFFLI